MSRCLVQHVGAGHQALDQERAEQDRHAGAGRHAERHGRHQRAALLGVGRALGGDHAAHVAGAEGLRARPFRSAARGRRRSSRSPRRRCRGTRPWRSRSRSSAGSGTSWSKQSLMPSSIPVLVSIALSLATTAMRDDREIAKLRQCEDAERHRHQRQRRPTDRGCPWSSAAFRSADRCRSSPASCRGRPR